ncbi:fumarylacetoacetate hydrolase family protein [Georgenia sp. Z1491]|uniref:fumarylacetoacetate hydrolase family protein n=1 Tax=Georgenia sp. Z1491 TaxID=3416707 RepID=UPI003CEC44C8
MVKLARWTDGDEPFDGFVDGETVWALSDGSTTLDLVRRGLAATLKVAAATIGHGEGRPLVHVELRTPLDPPSVRDFVAFEQHVEGVAVAMGHGGVVPEWYEAPTFYFTNPHTLRATGEEIPVPAGCEVLDLEAEVAVVVGGGTDDDGRSLDPERAATRIFGFTVFNDWSARDLQRREMKVSLGPAKGKDFAGTLGPWIVTADELADRVGPDGFHDLPVRAEINGEVLGEDTTAHMGWTFAELVTYASADSRVVPGDVLGSGTAGGGCLAELWGRRGEQVPPPLTEGDEVRVVVDGIGEVVNRVGARRAGSQLIPARNRRTP